MADSILSYHLRIRLFFPRYAVFTNSYSQLWGIIKSKIFCFSSKFVSLTQLPTQQIQFFKIQLCNFLVHMVNVLTQKIKEIHPVDLEKNVSQTDEQTDVQTDIRTNRTNFIDSSLKDGGLIMFLKNSRIKFS